jgi:beta-N-acetylhexosaminidase
MHLLVGFKGLTPDQELRSIIRDFRIGGIVLFRRNIQSPDQLKALLEETQAFAREILGRPLWVAIDQEGGPVQRFIAPFTQLPSARELAGRGPRAIVEWASKAAADLRRMDIQINLAPVLDVMPEGTSHFMEARSLGSVPERVAQLGRLWIETLQQNGISATAKHYPGLGQAESDPHHYAPVIRWQNEEAMQRDLEPFHEAVRAGIHCFMTSHALYPSLDPVWPATLSPIINNEWLRRKLGFSGVLLSDDLDMAAVSKKYSWDQMVRQGLLASIDFFLLCQRSENIEPFFQALSNGIAQDSALEEAHQKSLSRIEGLYRQHGIEPPLP